MKNNPELNAALGDLFGSGKGEKEGEKDGDGKVADAKEKVQEQFSSASEQAKEAARKARERAAAGAEKYEGQINQAKEAAGKVYEKTSGVFGSVRERLVGARSRAEVAREKAREKAREAAERAREAAGKAAESEFAQEAREAAGETAKNLDGTTGGAISGTIGRVRQHMAEHKTVETWGDALRKVFMSTDARVVERRTLAETRKKNMQWEQYTDDATGCVYYHNPALELTQWEEPECWADVARVRATIAARHRANKRQEAKASEGLEGEEEVEEEVETPTGTALVRVKQPMSTWQRVAKRLGGTPIIQGLLGAAAETGDAFRGSSAGRGVGKAQSFLGDKAADLREKWETSQNPWVYTASGVLEMVTSESEEAACVRETLRLDPSFRLDEFHAEMRAVLIPDVMRAWVTQETHVMRRLLTSGAYSQVSAILTELKSNRLYMDPNLLDLGEPEPVSMRMLDGQPTFLFQVTTHQINCVRDGDGNVVEGAEDDVRQNYYFVAVQREFEEASGELAWKVVEFAPIGSETVY